MSGSAAHPADHPQRVLSGGDEEMRDEVESTATEPHSVITAAAAPPPPPLRRGGYGGGRSDAPALDRPSHDWVGAVDRALARIHTEDGERALRELRRLMETQAMTVAQEQIRLYQRVLNTKLQALSQSRDLKVRLACIRAARALITVDYADSASRTSQLSFFANFLPHLMNNAQSTKEIDLAAQTVALIITTDFSLSNVIVDTELTKYVEWLSCRQSERYYYLSVGLQELAAAAPGAVLPKMKKIRRALMTALEHSSIKCRRATSLAFRGLVKLNAMDDSTQPEELVKDCERVILRNTTQGSAANPYLCHGVLLVMKEIVDERVAFDRDGSSAGGGHEIFTAITAACLKLCGATYPTYIRVTAVELLCMLSTANKIPFREHTADAVAACLALASSCPPHEPDADAHPSTPCEDDAMHVATSPALSAFTARGVDSDRFANADAWHQTAALVVPNGAPNLVREASFRSLAVLLETQAHVFSASNWTGPLVDGIRTEVVAALESCPPCPGAGACVLAITRVCSSARLARELTLYLLDNAPGLPLCPQTAQLLIEVGRSIPDLQHDLQETVVARVEDVLNAHRADPSGSAAVFAMESLAACEVDRVSARADRLSVHLLRLLQHPAEAVRKSAAATSVCLIVAVRRCTPDSVAERPQTIAVHRKTTPRDLPAAATPQVSPRATPAELQATMVEVLTLCVSDPSAEVRYSVLRSVRDWIVADHPELLANDECARYLCASLADERPEARECALDIAARIASRNEVLVDRMRKLVQQVTTELQCPTDAIQQEQAARMLGQLLKAAQAFSGEHDPALNDLLIDRLKSATNSRFKSAILETLSVLLECDYWFSKDAMRELVGVASAMLTNKQTVATRPAARLVVNLLRKGCVCPVDTVASQPMLLARIFESLKESDPVTASQMLELLGVIGAQDYSRGSTATQSAVKATSPDYDRHVAVKALLDILEAPSLVFHRREALQALQSILKAVPSIEGARPSALLHRVLPVILGLLEQIQSARTPDVALSESLFRALHHAVAMIAEQTQDEAIMMENRLALTKHLPRILALMKACWDPTCQHETLTLIGLTEVLHTSVDAMRDHAPWLMPRLIALVRRGIGEHGLAVRAVQAFGVLHSIVEAFLIPVCACLLDTAGATDQQPDLRIKCVQTLASLSCSGVPMKDVSARVIHALTRICQGVVTPPADARHGVGSEAIRTLCIFANAVGSEEFTLFKRSVVQSLTEIKSDEAQRAVAVLDGSASEDEVAEMLGDKYTMQQVPSSVGTPTRQRTRQRGGATPRNSASHRHRSAHHQIHSSQLKTVLLAYSSAHREEDYERWLHNLSHELLAQSPRTVLRACAHVGRGYPPLALSLFPPAFSLSWNAVPPEFQKTMSQAVRDVLLAGGGHTSTIAHPLLELCVFVERAYAQHFADAGEKQRPVHKFLPPRKLWPLAKAAGKHALALHWLEAEVFAIEKEGVGAHSANAAAVRTRYLDACREVVHINKCLEKVQQAEGVLALIKRKGVADAVNRPETYEDLGWWQRAYEEYERECKTVESKEWPYYVAGMMRCREHMGDWRGVLALSRTWVSDAVRVRTARAVSHAAWMLTRWDELEAAVKLMPQPLEATARRPGDSPPGCTAALYRAILAIKKGEPAEALRQIALSRSGLEKDLCEHVSGIQEKGRGYELLVTLQHLCECEEILKYQACPDTPAGEERRTRLRELWASRLRAMRHDAWHMRDTLVLRSLVVRPQDAIDDWLHYVSVLPTKRAARTLKTLLGGDTSVLGEQIDESIPQDASDPRLILIYLKHMWDIDTHSRRELVGHLDRYTRDVLGKKDEVNARILQEVFVVHAQWEQTTRPHNFWEAPHRDTLLDMLQSAIDMDVRDITPAEQYRVWHEWALLNFRISLHCTALSKTAKQKYSMSAVKGFVKCIQLSDPPELATQDVLRLLSLIPSSFGGCEDLEKEFRASLRAVQPTQWVTVIPQILSRLGSANPKVNAFIRDLMTVIAEKFPQRVLVCLSVPLRQAVGQDATAQLRQESAAAIVRRIREQHPVMCEEVDMMTTELVKIAVTVGERWSDHLIEANRLWLEGDGDRMMALLEPLHAELAHPPTIPLEKQFAALYQKDLTQARIACLTWKKTRHQMDMRRAWALYGQVYARLNDELKTNTLLYLHDTTTHLAEVRDLNIVVFGTEGVRILKFNPVLHVMGSKRRPKQVTIVGSNGEEYPFLLKGQEDLRLDQRVMQVLELVNSLVRFGQCEHILPLIETFAVVPLSPTAGLIGWVDHAQTFDDIVAEMRGRNAKAVREEIDLFTAEQHDLGPTLQVIQKVDALEHTLAQSNSDDIHLYLWLGSADASEWIERRSIFAHSAALMSMVGYILGLGDRHPGNMMIGHTGKIVHIDFADCFETAMHRKMFPERVPFRLTAMMARAMGVGGVAGTFRGACAKGMTILRKAKQPLMAMLEAFVHDPVVHCRLNILNQHVAAAQNPVEAPPHAADPTEAAHPAAPDGPLDVTGPFGEGEDTRPSSSSTYLGLKTSDDAGSFTEEQTIGNVTSVIKRIQAKLEGTDFPARNPAPHEDGVQYHHGLAVAEQVSILIDNAQSLENLAQCYAGWCPFW
eukprot:TRINITY_DN4273_c3_g1_i1.p1 TRINITY_DN4273_c3_g1~~TRINITY_DN4273_c3_g1_i1.p1  ORF type:complete len:2599 (+),score=909.51 TRINITY_DN4273_c3_g1_i1:104-7900(+)